MKNIIVAQSGGPTVAINASLVGVLREAVDGGKYDRVFGALHGISGVLKEDFKELTIKDENGGFSYDKELADLIYRSPSSYLGSCRYKMPEAEDDESSYKKIFEIFDKYEIAAFFYIGGNDSMDTVAKLSSYAEKIGSDVRIAGVPKTVDNDLIITDHTPGFGSAAKFIATSMVEITHDTAVYEAPCVTIVEIMGRDAGWLTASSVLARNEYSSLPQLIYLPEVAFSEKSFIEDIKKLLEKTTNIVVAVSEGIHDSQGVYLAATSKAEDRFGHAQLSGAGKVLEGIVKGELGIKCRAVELNLPQRCAAHLASGSDLKEAAELGAKAVDFTAEGSTGFMPVIKRLSDKPYAYEIDKTDVRNVANQEKKIPLEWINEAGNDVTGEMIDYLKPLIEGETGVTYKNGIPVYADISHLTRPQGM